MKNPKKFIKILKFSLILIFSLIFYPSISKAATTDATLFFNPGATTVLAGSTFNLIARVNPGSNTVQGINAVQIDVTFNPAVLQLSSVTILSPFTQLSAPVINNTNGTLSAVVFIATSQIITTSDVATLTFTASASGANSPVSFATTSNAAVNDGNGTMVVSTRTGATVTVNISGSAPNLTEITSITTPTSNKTPQYVFSSTKAGTITYAGDCSSSNVTAVAGNNTITFNTLSEGAHSNCVIRVTDSLNNVSANLNVSSFTVDSVAPTISSVSASNISASTATIDWTTNKLADSQVFYGINTSYGSQITLDINKVTSHSQVLSSLSSGTTYHYQVRSRSLAGVQAISSDYTFTTSSNGGGGGGGGGNTIQNCTSVVYDAWQTTCSNNWQYRNIKSQTPANCNLTTQQNNDTKRQCSSSSSNNGNSSSNNTNSSSSNNESNNLYYQEAETIYQHNQRVPLDTITAPFYGLVTSQYKGQLTNSEKYSIAFFIHYGTSDTIWLGAGERAGVLNSYLSVFSDLPTTTTEWQDVVKIANGRWPSEKNSKAEEKVQTNSFVTIYKRKPNMSNSHDNAAVTIMTYGLRPIQRNLNSEKQAIIIYKNIYKKNPVSASDWDIVRAIAYSGCVR